MFFRNFWDTKEILSDEAKELSSFLISEHDI